MSILVSFFVGGSLLAFAGAISESASIAPSARATPEQYCFSRPGGPFPAQDVPPMVTMIYNGVTLSTTPAAYTMCEVSPMSASIATSRDDNVSANLPTPSSVADEGSDSSLSGTWANSQSRNPTSGGLASGLGGPSSTSRALPASQGTQSEGAISMTNSWATKLSTAASPGNGESFATANASHNPTPVSSQVPPTTPTGESVTGSAIDAAQSASGGNNSPVLLDSSGALLHSISRSAITSASKPVQTAAQPPATGSADLLMSKWPSSSPNSGIRNATLELSSAAVEALQLAQFLKNLGVSVFNSSNWYTGAQSASLASSIANFSKQEHAQQSAIREMLHRTANTDVPACQYLLPSNASDMSLLVSMLKSIEVGAFLALAESLPPEDAPAVIVLSSMAGVAARQNAILHALTNINASMASFETPISATWAYNLAQGYVRPGSCAVELPILNLPTLYLNERITGYVQANTSVTFTWDAAGRAAASRSGKDLFIGWVNQVNVPTYTPLEALGDGAGTTDVPPGLSGTAFAVLTAQPRLDSLEDLTDATLAGPVVISLSQ